MSAATALTSNLHESKERVAGLEEEAANDLDVFQKHQSKKVCVKACEKAFTFPQPDIVFASCESIHVTSNSCQMWNHEE